VDAHPFVRVQDVSNAQYSDPFVHCLFVAITNFPGLKMAREVRPVREETFRSGTR
jgi:hypothetical protein